MDDFILLLQFMVLPIGMTLLFALVLPGAGTFLLVRNELMITLSLPASASAVLAVFALCGIPESFIAIRITLAVFLLVLIYSVIMKRISAPVLRQATLAGLLVGSQAVTRFSVALKPALEGEFRELLNGEMLAVSRGDLITVAVVVSLAILLVLRFFPLVRTYVLDEQSLLRFPSLMKEISLGVRILVVLLVTLGVVTIGPLLTTAFMILPALLGDNGKRGFTPVLVAGTGIGILGAVIGFPVALVADLPPAYMIAVVLIPVGVLFRIITK